jgi:hypothetical protein
LLFVFLLRFSVFSKVGESIGSSTIGLFGYEELGSDSNGFVCLTYSETQIDFFLDGPWKSARAFGIIANVCSGVTLLCLIGASCFTMNPIFLKILAGWSFFGSFSIMFTFLMFASNVTEEPYNGSFHFGGAMTIVGSISAFVTSLLILQIRPPGERYTVSTPSSKQNVTRRPTTTGEKSNETLPPRRNFPAPSRVTKPLPQKESAIVPDDIEAFQPGTETVTETILPDGTRKTVTTTIGADGSKTVTEVITRVD